MTLAFHKDVEDPTRPYARYYSFRRTRDKLVVRHSYQWAITAVLIGVIVVTLWQYSRYETINTRTKHTFNSIMTGLSIALGINLASALKSYAEMMRWRFLTMSWMTLREFDLILHCGELHKVIQLLWEVTKHRKESVNSRGKVARIWAIAVGWIGLNLLAQILVAMLGLTYSLDVSRWNIIQPGLINIADFSQIEDRFNTGKLAASLPNQMFAAHDYGIQGQDNNLCFEDDKTCNSECYKTVLTPKNYEYSFYRFLNYNADDPGGAVGTANVCSERHSYTTAACDSYVVDNLGGNSADGFTAYYKVNGKTQTLYIKEASPGGTTWMGDMNRNACEAYEGKYNNRAAHVVGFQMAMPEGSMVSPVSQNTVYDCCSYVGPIEGWAQEGDRAKYDLPDEQAFIIAGAIGWTGFSIPGVSGGNLDHSDQYVVYPYGSMWAVDSNMAFGEAVVTVQNFAAAAISSMDIIGPRANITSERQPSRALCLTVEWHWVIPLMCGIFALQCVSMLLVVLWANKALIIDDSYLSVAKLLAPMVNQLGEGGSVLKGEEIAHEITALRSQAGKPYKIFYGCRDLMGSGSGDGSDPNTPLNDRRSSGASFYGRGLLRAGIFEEGGDTKPKKDRPFDDGTYD